MCVCRLGGCALTGVDVVRTPPQLPPPTGRSRGVEVLVVNRNEYTAEQAAWADVVFTAGGDGTFLHGASKVVGREKLLIGLNTDPE